MGIPTWEYKLDFGDARKDKELECFCLSPPENCPRKGTLDIFQCVGTPIVISMPHFYDADPAILRQIESGVNPNKEDHHVYIHYESITGSPLSAAKRLQFAMDIVPIPEIDCMKNLPEVLMPMFWVEESAHLNKTYINVLKYQFFLFLKIMATIKWLCIIIGMVGCSMGAYLHYKKLNDVKVITPVTSAPKSIDKPNTVSETVNEISQDKSVNEPGIQNTNTLNNGQVKVQNKF